MKCPFCSYGDSKVTDSRTVENGIRRRRECQRCSLRFTTYERIQTTALVVSKQDNRREEFDREKLMAGIRKACAKRPIPSRTIEKMIEDIETELQRLGQVEVPTAILGTLVMERLRNLDRVAYIRYASVYRDFPGHRELRAGGQGPAGRQLAASTARRWVPGNYYTPPPPAQYRHCGPLSPQEYKPLRKRRSFYRFGRYRRKAFQ